MTADASYAPWDIQQERLQAALATIEARFGRGWLTQSPAKSPLQSLWQNNELQARLELHWFGVALETMDAIDRVWLTDQIVKARGKDANNRRGAIFEILGLAMFAGEAHRLVPAPPNTRGYDGHLEFAASQKALLSIKNFGKTRYARDVDEFGMRTLQRTRETARLHNVPWMGVLVESTRWPTKEDWLRLERVLCTNVENGSSRTPLMHQLEPWNILWQPQPAWISSAVVSSQMTAIVPFHPNEIQIYHGKLEEQISQVSAQLARQAANAAIVCVRIDESASIPHLEAWAVDYLRRHPDGPVDEVFFYQPAMLIDEKRTALSHYIARFGRAGLRRPDLHLTLPAGLPLQKPSYLRLANGPALLDRYMFQCGDLYRSANTDTGLPLEASFGVTALNVRVHALLEGGGEYVILSSKQSGDGKLRLFE